MVDEAPPDTKFAGILLRVAEVAARHPGEAARDFGLLLADAAELFPHDAEELAALRAKLNPAPVAEPTPIESETPPAPAA
jgi:hypothetical protein